MIELTTIAVVLTIEVGASSTLEIAYTTIFVVE